jgi:CRISPR-associated protein Cas6
MQSVDLAFQIQAVDPIPCDHAYPLYGALSRVLPALHSPNGVQIHPLRGRQLGDRLLQLGDGSQLVIRCAAVQIPTLVPLAGKSLDVAGRRLRLGVPEVRGLIPAAVLRSRLVTIKLAHSEATGPPSADAFLASLRRKLDAINVSAEAYMTLGKRRTVRVKQNEIVGYEVVVEHLTAEESLTLQTEPNLFSRQHLGCGVFVPAGSKDA